MLKAYNVNFRVPNPATFKRTISQSRPDGHRVTLIELSTNTRDPRPGLLSSIHYHPQVTLQLVTLIALRVTQSGVTSDMVRSYTLTRRDNIGILPNFQIC